MNAPEPTNNLAIKAYNEGWRRIEFDVIDDAIVKNFTDYGTVLAIHDSYIIYVKHNYNFQAVLEYIKSFA